MKLLNATKQKAMKKNQLLTIFNRKPRHLLNNYATTMIQTHRRVFCAVCLSLHAPLYFIEGNILKPNSFEHVNKHHRLHFPLQHRIQDEKQTTTKMSIIPSKIWRGRNGGSRNNHLRRQTSMISAGATT